MKLLTRTQLKHLLANGRWNAARLANAEVPADFRPVVKLFCPWNMATWLLSEIDPEDPDIAFGLCDLGTGCPEIGRVRLSAIAELRSREGISVERDRHFQATKTLQAYAEEARRHGRTNA